MLKCVIYNTKRFCRIFFRNHSTTSNSLQFHWKTFDTVKSVLKIEICALYNKNPNPLNFGKIRENFLNNPIKLGVQKLWWKTLDHKLFLEKRRRKNKIEEYRTKEKSHRKNQKLIEQNRRIHSQKIPSFLPYFSWIFPNFKIRKKPTKIVVKTETISKHFL